MIFFYTKTAVETDGRKVQTCGPAFFAVTSPNHILEQFSTSQSRALLVFLVFGYLIKICGAEALFTFLPRVLLSAELFYQRVFNLRVNRSDDRKVEKFRPDNNSSEDQSALPTTTARFLSECLPSLGTYLRVA